MFFRHSLKVSIVFLALIFDATNSAVGAQTETLGQTFIRANTTIDAKPNVSDLHRYIISPDASLVADICPGAGSQHLVISESSGNILFSANSNFKIACFSPDSTEFLFAEREEVSKQYGQPKYKWTIKVWNRKSQSIMSIHAENQNGDKITFLGNAEIAYLEDTDKFSLANYVKLRLAVKASELTPSKLCQRVLIKTIQDPTSIRTVELTLDVPKGWFGKVGSLKLCTTSNGNFFCISWFNGNISKDFESDHTSLVLYNSKGEKISSLMNLDGVFIPIWLSDDGNRIITSARSHERSKFGRGDGVVTVVKHVGDNLTEWDWSTGKECWTRSDIRFFGNVSVCNGRIAVLAIREPKSQQYIEIINESSGKTERIIDLNCSDIKSIQLTATTILIIYRGDQRQLCYLDSGAIVNVR